MTTHPLRQTLIVLALIPASAHAEQVLQIYCADCRDSSHSVDYGNFAVNQTYGQDSWVLEDEYIIVNPEGSWVHVDLAFILEDNIISNFGEFIGLDLGVPTGKFLIETTTDTTVTDSYVIDLDMIDTMGPLPVGAPEQPSGYGTGGDSSGSSGAGTGGVGAGGAGTGSAGGGSGGGSGGGLACTSAGDGEWFCVSH